MTFLENATNFIKGVIRRLNVKVALLIVVVLSVTVLLVRYFRRSDSVSPISVAGAFVVPFQQGVNELGAFLFERNEERLGIEAANKKIAELTEENEALTREITDLQQARQENEEFRKMFATRERMSGYTLKAASVIGNSGVNVFHRFTIDLGSVDGIRVNMNVISGDGALIGLVSYVGLNYSVVTSIIEDGISVAARTGLYNDQCIASGSLSEAGPNVLHLENALLDVDFSKDGALYTSSISDRFLPDILIGYVTETYKNSDGLTQAGSIRPAVDFTKIRQVLIIMETKEEKQEAGNE